MNDPLDGAVAPWLWLVCQGVSRARRPAWLSLHMRLPHVMCDVGCGVPGLLGVGRCFKLRLYRKS